MLHGGLLCARPALGGSCGRASWLFGGNKLHRSGSVQAHRRRICAMEVSLVRFWAFQRDKRRGYHPKIRSGLYYCYWPQTKSTTSSVIDTAFDFRSDTPSGKDPDTWSPTLCRYHKALWSKRLPSGEVFDLDYQTPPFYLRHRSSLGEFCLSSDTVVPTFSKQASLTNIFQQLPAELQNFEALRYTIGGMMLFPANQIGGKWTINQARGCTKKICDRFDYTVECVRRHYSGGKSPLSDVLARYADFFGLFCDFHGFVEFFHLQDLVTDACNAVRFFTPFDDFESPLSVPTTVDAYLDYRTHAIDFLNARNRRVRDWSERNLNGELSPGK